MKTCVIFCAAGFDGLIAPIPAGAFVIAADGGFRHTRALGLEPDAILGDFDSLGFVPEHSRVFPVEKDDTDSMLAIRLGLSEGCREFLLYGALDGPRLDHTVANFQALGFLARHGAHGTMIGRDYIVTAISGGTLRFPETAEGIISLFCLGEKAEHVTLRGLYYPLEDGTLEPDFPLGVSNHFTHQPASVTVGSGTVLALWDRANGLAIREDEDAHL